MHLRDAGVAHPVERHLAKVEVASASLVTRSIIDGLPVKIVDFILSSYHQIGGILFMRTLQNILVQVVAIAILPVALIGSLFQKDKA